MATAAELEQQYQGIRGGRESYSDIQNRLAGELGIADRRRQLESVSKAILDTERLLEGVPTAVQLRARQLGGPMTAAQTSRMTSAQSQPFTKQLGELSRTEQTAQVGLNELNTELLRRLGLISQERTEETADWTRRIAAAQAAEQFAEQKRLQEAQIAAAGNQYGDLTSMLDYIAALKAGGAEVGGMVGRSSSKWGNNKRASSTSNKYSSSPLTTLSSMPSAYNRILTSVPNTINTMLSSLTKLAKSKR